MPENQNVSPQMEMAVRALGVVKPELMVDLTLEALKAMKARDAFIDALLKVATIPNDEDRLALIARFQVLQDELEASQESVLARYR